MAGSVGLDAFCEREYPRLVGTLGLYCGDRFVAEDLAQETLVRVCANWRRVGVMAAPGVWAHKVALNLARSRFRRLAAERRAYARRGTDIQEIDTDSAGDMTVRRAVAALPGRQRAALVLRYWLDLPAHEVAAMLGTTTGAVHQLTHRALVALRNVLAVDVVDELERQGIPDAS